MSISMAQYAVIHDTKPEDESQAVYYPFQPIHVDVELEPTEPEQ